MEFLCSILIIRASIRLSKLLRLIKRVNLLILNLKIK